MLDLQSGALNIKEKLKAHNLSPLELCMGFTNLYQSSSSIDLILTDQPNLIVDSGVHPSLHSDCYHQITHCRLSLNIEYPPSYER